MRFHTQIWLRVRSKHWPSSNFNYFDLVFYCNKSSL